jgi:hypothetical protein
MKTRIGILYIATGKYIRFWKEFFESAERYFLIDEKYEKHYFVFTDANSFEYDDNLHVHKIFQELLSWPYITLERFSIFQKAHIELEKMDYIYFFNANMLFMKLIDEEILPSPNIPLIMVKHPGFFDKNRLEYTYDLNKNSLAYISEGEGIYYFMGGLNGGEKRAYLDLIDELKKRVDTDKKNNIIALWHDESHLNRYAIDYCEKIKILNSSYGYPEAWDIPFEPKILIRDKSKYGGYDFLRNIVGEK